MKLKRFIERQRQRLDPESLSPLDTEVTTLKFHITASTDLSIHIPWKISPKCSQIYLRNGLEFVYIKEDSGYHEYRIKFLGEFDLEFPI